MPNAAPSSTALAFLDVDRILEPIAGEDPAGTNLRFTPDYDDLAEARREDDDADIDKGIWQSEARKADWPVVIARASQILSEKSKDLQVATWLGQAAFRQHGLDGLVSGLALLRGLIGRYWVGIYPRPEEGDGDEQRLACLSWFDNQMARELFLLPIVEEIGGEHPLTYQIWLGAQRLQRLATTDPRAYRTATGQGEPTPEIAEKAISRTSNDYYRQRYDALTAVRSGVSALEATRAAVAGGSAPHLAAMASALDHLLRFTRDVLKKRGIEPVQPAVAEVAAETALATDEPGAATAVAVTAYYPAGPRNREEAYDMLARIAEFLVKEEPHSPTSYLVRRAASWGHLSLEELYGELLGSTAEVQRLFSVLRLGGGRDNN
ncbi:MAG: type VI secretion system protein TssA [Azospirillaceae bacterium]|nr:type VI secretion system protein TssA [Azospirillaceae bacterium]